VTGEALANQFDQVGILQQPVDGSSKSSFTPEHQLIPSIKGLSPGFCNSL
jgi:hypothetical protein